MERNILSKPALERHDAEGELPILASGVLDELRGYGDGDDDSLLFDLAKMFFEGADANIATMRETLASGDLHRFERAAHSLKGSAATLGAHRLSERCRRIEENARNGHFVAGEHELDDLVQMVAQIREQLDVSLGIASEP